MKKSNFYTKLIDVSKNPVIIYIILIGVTLLIIALGKTYDMIIPIATLFGVLAIAVIFIGADKDERDINRAWSELRRKGGKVQGKYLVGDRIKELINKINSTDIRPNKIGSADILWQLETSVFRTEDILENYELPSLVELQKLSELFFFRTLKIGAGFSDEHMVRRTLCNMLYIITGDKSYLSEDCRLKSSSIREIFAEYEAAYNAECYELLESYERSMP